MQFSCIKNLNELLDKSNLQENKHSNKNSNRIQLCLENSSENMPFYILDINEVINFFIEMFMFYEISFQI